MTASTVGRGLSEQEAAERLAVHGPNALPRRRPPLVIVRVARHTVEPLSLVLLAAALVSAVALKHLVEGVAITAIVVLNVCIASIQEDRADDAIAALAAMTAPTARVRRDGVVAVRPAVDLVVGDVVELAAGDRVPADVTLVEAVSFAVDESILTGESLPVARNPDGAARAGTLVVRGRGVGVVDATGSATELGRIASSIDRPVEAPLVRELRAVARTMSIVAIVLGALLVPVAAWRGTGDDSLGDAVLAGVALAVAAIPEGLATVVTISLALGARSMASRGAIVRRLPALETLGSTTVICTDKTGTLTTGHVAVVGAYPVVDEAALWTCALRCVDAEDGTGDPIDVAIVDAAGAAGISRQPERRLAERPFDSVSRSMTTVTDVGGASALTVKGAPEVVLARCRGDSTALLEQSERASAKGLRMLAVATGATADLDAGDLDAVGLLAFADPVRSSTADAVAACRRAGIRIVMVTGDHVNTAVTIARAAGLDDAPAMTGAMLRDRSPDEAAVLLRDAAVIARVEPATKVALVNAHRAAGEVVAMTGDGVNDAPALRAADIGVALAGESGTDVAREAAGLVVTSGDLGTIVDAVREGRRIYRNIGHVVGYLLTGNLSEILVVAACLVFVPEVAVPLLPVQLLWCNLVTDGLPALALGVDRLPTDPLDGPPRRVEDRLLAPRRVAVLAARSAVLAATVLVTARWAVGRGWSDDAIRTELLLTLIVGHVLVAYVTRATRLTFERGWWRNRVLLGSVLTSLLLQVVVFTTPPGRSGLRLAALPPVGWLAAGLAPMVAIAVLDAGRVLARRR